MDNEQILKCDKPAKVCQTCLFYERCYKLSDGQKPKVKKNILNSKEYSNLEISRLEDFGFELTEEQKQEIYNFEFRSEVNKFRETFLRKSKTEFEDDK